jgi:WD40 repeat protein
VLCVNVYPHSSEVVALASSPADASLLITSFTQIRGSSLKNRVALWKMGGDESIPKLDMTSELMYPEGASVERAPVTAVLWEEAFSDTVFTVEAGRVAGWNLANCGGGPAMEIALSPDGGLVSCGGIALNPHISTVLAVCVGDVVLGYDTREGGKVPVWRLKGSPDQLVRDCDFNPNKPYYLCSGGDDGKIRFWDYRKTSECLQQTFPGGSEHSHWITSVEYNPHHDSLVLSSGTDGLVNLYCAKSVSSSPGGSDYLISSYNGFSQSAYRAAWSSSDAWSFAAISWDGKAVLAGVPDKEKMSILTEN